MRDSRNVIARSGVHPNLQFPIGSEWAAVRPLHGSRRIAIGSLTLTMSTEKRVKQTCTHQPEMAGVGSATLLCLTENSACARQNTLTKTGTRPKLTIFADKPTQHLLLLTLEFGKKHTNIQVFSNG